MTYDWHDNQIWCLPCSCLFGTVAQLSLSEGPKKIARASTPGQWAGKPTQCFESHILQRQTLKFHFHGFPLVQGLTCNSWVYSPEIIFVPSRLFLSDHHSSQPKKIHANPRFTPTTSGSHGRCLFWLSSCAWHSHLRVSASRSCTQVFTVHSGKDGAKRRAAKLAQKHLLPSRHLHGSIYGPCIRY